MNFVYWYCLFLLGPFFPLIELSLAQWGEKWVVSKEMKRGKFNGLTRKILMVIDVSIVTKKGKNWTTAKSRDKFTIEIYWLEDNWTLKRKFNTYWTHIFPYASISILLVTHTSEDTRSELDRGCGLLDGDSNSSWVSVETKWEHHKSTFNSWVRQHTVYKSILVSTKFITLFYIISILSRG